MEIKEVILTQKFEDDTKHIRDALMKEKMIKNTPRPKQAVSQFRCLISN